MAEWLTVPETVPLLGVSRRGVYRLIESGDLAAVKRRSPSGRPELHVSDVAIAGLLARWESESLDYSWEGLRARWGVSEATARRTARRGGLRPYRDSEGRARFRRDEVRAFDERRGFWRQDEMPGLAVALAVPALIGAVVAQVVEP